MIDPFELVPALFYIGFVLFVVVASFGSRWGNIAQFENVAPTDSAPVAVTPTGSELP